MASKNDTQTDKDPWNDQVREKFESKSKSKFMDPCQDLANKSIRCMTRNDGDRSMCQDFFAAYRDCKKDWIEKRRAEGRSWF